VRDGEVLSGKFLAALVLYLGLLAVTAIGPAILYTLHPFAVPPVLAGISGSRSSAWRSSRAASPHRP